MFRLRINRYKLPKNMEVYDFEEHYEEYANNPPILLKDQFLFDYFLIIL